MGSPKRPTAEEKRAATERDAEARRQRERSVRVVIGDLAIADVVLAHAVALVDPNRVEGYADLTLLRAYLTCVAGRVHNAAEHARALHPPIPRQFFRRNALGGPAGAERVDDGEE